MLPPKSRHTPASTAPAAAGTSSIVRVSPGDRQPAPGALLPASSLALGRHSPSISLQAETEAAAAQRRAAQLEEKLKKAKADAQAAEARLQEAQAMEAAAAAATAAAEEQQLASQGERSHKEAAEVVALRGQLTAAQARVKAEQRTRRGVEKDLQAAQQAIDAWKGFAAAQTAEAVIACHDSLSDFAALAGAELRPADLQRINTARAALAATYADLRAHWGLNRHCKHQFNTTLGAPGQE